MIRGSGQNHHDPALKATAANSAIVQLDISSSRVNTMKPATILFLFFSIGTWVFSQFAWQLEYRDTIHLVLLVTTSIFAIMTVANSKPRKLTLLFVIIIYIFGQWWLFEQILMFAFWRITGFV
jgi:hypothetical protein